MRREEEEDWEVAGAPDSTLSHSSGLALVETGYKTPLPELHKKVIPLDGMSVHRRPYSETLADSPMSGPAQ